MEESYRKSGNKENFILENQRELFERFIRHENLGHLQTVNYYNEFESENFEGISPEEKSILNRAYKNSKKQFELNKRLGPFPNKNREYFSPRESINDFIGSKDKIIREASLGFDFRGNGEMVYTNKPLFNAILSTVLGNSINYALEDSKIYLSLKLNNPQEKLEIIVKNLSDGKQKRNAHGEGKGLGTKFLDIAMPLYKGKWKAGINGGGLYKTELFFPYESLRE